MTAKRLPPDVWPGMSDATWKAIGVYTRWLADRLWLKDWTLTLKREPLQTDDDAYAKVLPVEGRKLASIWFSRTFADEPAEVIKNSIIHELIHCSHRDMTDVIRCTMNNHVLGQQAWDVLWEAFRVATEVHVDSMATAFAAQVADDSLLDAITSKEVTDG